MKYVDEVGSGGMTYIPSLMASRGRRVRHTGKKRSISNILFRRPEGKRLVFKMPL
jgi:hypothetical protein